MTINLILQSATKSVNPQVKAFPLGDGYEQTHSTAIADTEIWTVSTIPLDDDDANDLETALNALQGDTFTWIPPYGSSGDYRLNSRITRTMVGYRRSVLQFSLRKIITLTPPFPLLLQFEFDIRADYYGSTPAEDILDGSYGGRNDLPWLRQGTSGQFVGYTMQVFFDEGDGGAGWVYYFLRVMIDGVNVTTGGIWYQVSQGEQKKAFTGNIRSGILSPRAVNITAVPV